MSFYYLMRDNWLTQKPRFTGAWSVFILVGLAALLTGLDWSSWPATLGRLQATPALVFEKHQYYRLWTSLFVHADASHIFSNMVLFVPLVYLLGAYYGGWLTTVSALVAGGLINGVVLQTLPPDVSLVGISGVDNWLGAVWLTLFYLIDRRESRRRRFAVVLFISFVLFVPDAYKPGISYQSHFVGYILGVFSGAVFYHIKKTTFQNAEVYEKIIEDDHEFQSLFPTPISSHDELSGF